MTGTGIGFVVGVVGYVVLWFLAQITEESTEQPFNVLALLLAGGLGALVGYAVKSARRGYTRHGLAETVVEAGMAEAEDSTYARTGLHTHPPEPSPTAHTPLIRHLRERHSIEHFQGSMAEALAAHSELHDQGFVVPPVHDERDSDT